MREGLQVEQELQIERLSKQLLIGQGEINKALSDKEAVAKDFKRIQEDFRSFKREYEMQQNEKAKELHSIKLKHKEKVT